LFPPHGSDWENERNSLNTLQDKKCNSLLDKRAFWCKSLGYVLEVLLQFSPCKGRVQGVSFEGIRIRQREAQ
jgi:hypothetical protein